MISRWMTSKSLRGAGLAALALSAVAALSACSHLPLKNHNSDQGAVVSRGQRISIVAFDQKLSPSKSLAGIGYYLPPAQDVASWPLSGGPTDTPIQHVDAAPNFKVAWSKSIGAPTKGDTEVIVQPVSDGRLIYVMDGEARVSALDVNTGNTAWSVDLNPHNKRDKIAFGGGLALANGKLFVTSGYRFIDALDPSNGKVIWSKPTDTQFHAAPTANDTAIFVTDVDNQIFAFDQSSGDMLWTYQAIAEPARLMRSSSPIVSGGLVYAPFSSGELVAINASTGDPVWEQVLAQSSRTNALSEIRDIAGRPVLYNGTVFAASHSGIFEAMNATTGDPKWQIQTDSINTPWVSGDVVFLVSLQGELIAANRDNGQIYWLQDLNVGAQHEKKGVFGLGREKMVGKIPLWTGPVLASNRLILFNSLGDAVAYDPKTGTKQSALPLGGAVYVAPIVVGTKLFVITDDAKLVAIG